MGTVSNRYAKNGRGNKHYNQHPSHFAFIKHSVKGDDSVSCYCEIAVPLNIASPESLCIERIRIVENLRKQPVVLEVGEMNFIA